MSDERVRRRMFLQAVGGALLASPATAGSDNGSHFAVSASHSPSVVAEGDESVLTGTITNTGEEEDTQIIELDVTREGEQLDSKSTTVSLDPGESATETRTADYQEYPEPGDYVGEVCSDDDCESVTWTVAKRGESGDDPASFEVTMRTLTNPTAGDPVEATVRVSNTGDEEATQDLTFGIDDLGNDTATVTLDGGDETTVEFSVPTEQGDGGEYTATVTSEDDSDSSTCTVEPQPASLAVEIADVTAPTAGEPVETVVDLSNTGGQPADQEITLEIDGLGSASRTVSLDGQAETTVTLAVQTEQGDDGEYTATVSSEDDSQTVDVVVEPQPASLAVEIGEKSVSTAGEPVEMDVVVTNTGDRSGNQEITLEIDGLGSASQTVSLDGQAETTVTLAVQTEQGDGGEYTATVSSEDDSQTVDVVVEPQQASLAVEIADVTAPTAGEPVETVVDLSNTGGQPADQEITLTVDGLGMDRETVSLDGQEETTVRLSVPTEQDEAGEYTATVSSENDSDSLTVTVAESETENDTDVDDETATGGDDDENDGSGTGVANETEDDTVDDGSGADRSDETEDDTVDDDGPGFTVISTVVGVSSTVGYALKRRIERRRDGGTN